MDRAALRKELVRDEGYSQTAYRDSEGFWTIGIGHYLGTEKRILTLTSREVEAFYEADGADAGSAVLDLFPAITFAADARYRALVNMAFNLGQRRLSRFKRFIAAVNEPVWSVAAAEMMNSKWAAQVGQRADRLRDM